VNPLRIRILTEIDHHGFALATLAELAESFRADQHWHNWAAKWHLDVDVSDSPDADVSFVRKPIK
jgi:hypothetical protein